MKRLGRGHAMSAAFNANGPADHLRWLVAPLAMNLTIWFWAATGLALAAASSAVFRRAA
jgi:hypothetical protein